MKRLLGNSSFLSLCLLVAFAICAPSFAACTIGAGTCCLGAGGASDNPATKLTWVPDAGTTVWTNATNWDPNNIPDSATEYAYIQSDWQVPAWPAASYSLACLAIGSGTMTATPAGSTVTVSIPSATVTATIRSATSTISIPSATVTATIRSATSTISIPSSTATVTIPTAVAVTATNGSDRINWTAHGKVVNDPIIITTTGTMPAPLVSGVVYYVRTVLTADRFTLAATPGGALINLTSNGSGLTGTSPSVVTWNAHGLAANDPVSFTTTGTLPTGITSGTTYYVAAGPAPTANTFSISATQGGNAFRASGTQSGTHTARARGLVTWAGHGLTVGTPVSFTTTGALPTGLIAGTTYYVATFPAPAANTFAVAATAGGVAIITSGTQSGTHTGRGAGVINWTGHGLAAGSPVAFTTTGTLPTGLTPSTTYYVAATPAPTANAFSVAATAGGDAIIFTGSQSGTHTGGAPGVVTWTAHGLAADMPVKFTTTGTLPTGIVSGTTYYVASAPAPTANTFSVASTIGGAAILTSGSQSGTHTATSYGTINWTAHGFAAGSPVLFTTTGALPTGMTASTTYFVASSPAPTANAFSIAAAAGGEAIHFRTPQSGTHTGRSPGIVTLAAHGLSVYSPVSFTTTGALPTGLTAGTTYYVAAAPAPAANTFAVSATPGGTAIITTGTQSGTHTLAARVLSIVGENFTNLTPGSLTTNGNFVIRMGGSNPQTFANVDAIPKLVIDNDTTVSLPNAFTVSTDLSIAPGSGTLQIAEGLTLSYTGSALVIPSSATVEVLSGATFTAMGGITVNGVLKVNAGAKVLIGTGRTLQVNAGGLLRLQGTSGNAASLDAASGGSFTLNVAGSINANYFSISRTTTAGLNITTAGSDSIQTLSNGDFHYIASAGKAITLNTAKNLPNPDPSGLGFFDDSSFGNVSNIDATNYTGTPVTIEDWAGLGGSGDEIDPGGKIDWGAQADLAIQITNQTASGNPAATIGKGSADTLFTTFGFSLNGAGAATDVTSVILTLTGSNVASDVKYLKVYGDANNNCVYNAGVDAQIGSDLTLAGSPPTATISIPASTVTVSDTTPRCIHVILATNPNAQTGDTLAVSVVGTTDVVNSQAYSFSQNSGPPVSGGSSTITGAAVKRWGGGNGGQNAAQNWNANTGDWTPAGFPATTDDCQIGPAYSYTSMNGNYTCTNMDLATSGRMGWNGTANTLNILGALVVGSSYTFTTATAGNIALNSTAATQSISGSTTFPGNLVINNTFGGDGLVSVDSNFTVTGNLTLTRGVLRIASGNNLTVMGTATVNGGTLDIEPGATFTLGDGRTLTIGASGTLQIVGSASQAANFTCSGTTTGCAIAVNGTIQAQYYSVNRLAVAGLDIATGATIDATYHLQNGSFTYPIGASPIMLRLNRKVPGDAIADMTFDTAGSAATGAQSILTNTTAGVLTVSNYSGDLTNCCTTAPTYTVSWVAPTTTLKLTLEGSAPTLVDQGDTGKVIARYGLQQTQAGPYSDTDVTSLKVTMQGSQNSADVSALRLYYDSGCAGSGGVQVGTSQTFSGSPPTATFSGLSGATVQASISSPPKRCFYVEADIAAGATVADTVGVSIVSSTDVVNSQGYQFNGSYSPPLAAGTSLINGNTIIWSGTTSSDWATTSNWNLGRLPTAADNCIINSATNSPVISAAGAVCKALTIGNGTLTVNTGQTISLYGSLANTGTLTLSGTASVTVRDDGVTPTNQTLQSSTSLASVVFNKTAGGIVYIGGSNLTISNFSMPAAQNFTFNVRDGDTLILPNGATITSGTFQVDGGGDVKISSGQTFTVAGGTLYVNGTNDAYPQSTSNKGKFTINGSGTWGFVSTSGTVNLTGFIFDSLDDNGVRINGTTTLSNLRGGQFTSLSTNYATLKALQINTSGSIPSVAANIGWDFAPGSAAPPFTTAYLIGYSSGCASQTVTFDQWFGDWFTDSNDTPEDKINTTACTFTLGASASAVSVVNLRATGYDSAVSVDWETTYESSHQGFNVMRSLNPVYGYVRVNSQLIRNDLTSTTGKGKYRYLDLSAENGQVYYYLIQDVASSGATTLHGPVSALAGSVSGPPPGSGGDVNDQNSENDTPSIPPPDPDIANAGLKDLGNGVKILAQTSGAFRIEILPATEVYSASTWNASYQQVRIPGYSSILDPGKPEIPDRVILVEVEAGFGEASVLASSVEEASPSSHKLQPVPTWAAGVGGLLAPSYSPDAAAYASATLTPSAYFEVATALVDVAGRKYVSIRVNPLRYLASTETVHRADKILLDVALGGNSWVVSPPASAFNVSPSAVEGALRVRYGATGVYELTYEQMEEVGVEGPFKGRPVSGFRVYSQGSEIPIEVGGGATFGAGSFLRFAAVHTRQLEDDYNEVVLTPYSLGGIGSAMRMETIDADPAGMPEGSMTTTTAEASAEQDLMYIFDVPFGNLVDRFYWKRVYAENGKAGQPEAFFNVPVSMPGLQADDGTTVHVDFNLRGRKVKAFDSVHHVGLYVNSVPGQVGDAEFSGDGPTSLSFELPSTYFVDGANTLKIEAMPDLTTSGDYQLVDLDRVSVRYPSALVASNGVARLADPVKGGTVTITGFSGDAVVHLYDVSLPGSTATFGNLSTVSLDAGVTTQTTFALRRTSLPSGLGKKLVAVEEGAYLVPAQLALVDRFGTSLRDTSRGADLILVGPEYLLDEAKSLVEYRQSQGLRVAKVTPEQIYAEFSHGSKSSQAIRDFVRHAYSSWVAPAPKYLLFLGDATYDPRDRLEYGGLRYVMPMPLVKGSYEDYGGDHWFVSDDNDVALLSAGRLPTRDPNLIRQYVDKLIAYERGDRAPTGAEGRQVLYVSDRDDMNEQFKAKARILGESFGNEFPDYTPVYLDRAEINNDAALRSTLISQFGASPLLMTYVGHGAEDLWGSSGLFTSEHAAALSNSRLPMVVGLNCLNASFYDADPDLKSLGESLVLNPSGGAAAFLGFTTLTVPTAQVGLQTALQNELAAEIAKSSAELRLGDIILRAKASVGGNSHSMDAVRSFSLIGDPSTKMPRAFFASTGGLEPAAPTEAQQSAEEGGGGCLRARGTGRSGSAVEFLATALLFCLPILAGRRFVRRRVNTRR